ncbi:MAG: HipA domain-containing protein [Candidatus Methanomethylophilaceae archaeon]|nr:HipA domain-containing protein [Candidatus Methanomethylophilaceae archaeon]MBR6911294.1 HipA domain-containing protein [Candidatus Methanomethylophilaceae archaeon]
MDYSDYPLSSRYYSGSERKIGIVIDEEEWILKFQYKDELKYRFNHISEHIGSKVFNSIGIPAQITELGTYKGEEVVACRNFIPEGCMFVPFNDVGESTLERDRDAFQYSYEDVMAMLSANKKLTDQDSTIDLFWDMYIVDALLGNFDRHGSNWGFIKNNNEYTLAPIFDNGSCLYPQMIDEDMMLKIIESPDLTEDRVYRFPTSQIHIGSKKSSYHDVISSMRFDECNNALLRVFPRIDMDDIFKIVDSIGSISEIHKRFYKHMLRSRYELILKDTYRRLA